MDSSLARSRLGAQTLVCLTAIAIVTSPVRGQAGATVSGVVTDTDGLAIIGAVVSVANTSLASKTDERGEFRITGMPSGMVEVRARRIGFAPETQRVEITASENPASLRFQLAALPAMLDRVVIRRERMRYTGRLAGYYQRLERRSSGQFITREEFDRNESRSLSQVLARTPGVSSVMLRSGGGAVRMRGRTCRPLVWIDGVPMPAGEVDLDAFPVHTLQGAELYLGSTSAPIDYTGTQGRSNCGSILLWSRGRDTESAPRSRSEPVDLEALVASLSVYPADQVDERAELRSNEHLEAAYPPELYATKTTGTVVAEFVVDAAGRMESETFTIISSTHSLLSGAVRRALQQSSFEPAVKGGRAVRQVVRQRFDFGPDTARLSTTN